MFGYENGRVHVKIPDYFYQDWAAVRLVTANKTKPSNLPTGTVPDFRPVIMGNAE